MVEMMNRQERKNMIEFIERMKDIDKDSLIYMTDADIEHIYSTVYNSYIELAE
jgi:phosphoribosylamine-glycine ligase